MRQHSPPRQTRRGCRSLLSGRCFNRILAPAVFPHYRGRVLFVRVEQHINQTLEGVDCDGFQYAQESPHERTSFSGPA